MKATIILKAELDSSKGKYKDIWDNGEFYFVASEITKNLSDQFNIEYLKISHCSGILTITNKCK